ncbi:cysteine hydrolase family protein [Ignicoccus hospitalis]|uniref:Isochorismatase hydrolase n=1 Tax=Ignicoccus hospitalis (strain KIN4/I / DSM 18386 / JCM 14125) TaxID=453591 RepID=A8ABT1_IGNH4|nr:isochorismatase family cysteine hydrolase [Ignicoccus hospitalis]ABU82383.1 isochorismatase hydrolase [Ignicoccus hospitalis KIN4/I]HIH90858.1 cysteine hydrolase [Desulfurococcaceae archaeon]
MKALLIIDMLNDFVNPKGKLYVPKSETIIPKVKELKRAFKEAGLPVIYTNDAHLPGVDKELELWGPHAVANTWGAQVVEELAPEEGDYVVTKRRYSAFFSTDLDLLLRELGVSEVVLTGVATNVCVLHTAADAFFRGYKVTVVEDATMSVPPEEQQRWLEYMKAVYGAEVVSTARAIEALTRP